MADYKRNDISINPTQDSNKPIDGKRNETVINQLQIRQVSRTPQSIANWRSYHVAADSRYNPNRARMYDLYDDVLLDGHLSGIITKRIDTILNKHIYFEKNGKMAPELDVLIRSIEFRNIIRTILETQFWGISGFEFVPGQQLDFRPIPRKHIKPHWQRITIEEFGEDGYDYTELKNVWIIGEPRDLGLLLKCAPYAIYKRGNVADWANYIEIFGSPVRIIKYDAYDEQTKIELKEVLEESGNALALMIPKQAEFDMKDGKQSNGDGQLQEKFLKSMNDEMSIIVLGNTETSSSGKNGSYAKGKVHQDEQQEIAKSDIAYVQSHLNAAHFLNILKSYGYPVDGGSFRFKDEINVQYLQTRINIDMKVASKVKVPTNYWYDTYGIPKPDKTNDQEELRAEQETASKPNSKDPQDPDPEENLSFTEKRKISIFKKALTSLGFFA